MERGCGPCFAGGKVTKNLAQSWLPMCKARSDVREVSLFSPSGRQKGCGSSKLLALHLRSFLCSYDLWFIKTSCDPSAKLLVIGHGAIGKLGRPNENILRKRANEALGTGHASWHGRPNRVSAWILKLSEVPYTATT
jgi:hypothetical protein